jgi:hypothetical protein
MNPLSHPRRSLTRRAAGTVAAVLLSGTVAGTMALGGPAWAGTSASHAAAVAGPPSSFSFSTLDNSADPTFNQLLGINAHNVISGYLGSGAAGHPNRGYLLSLPYAQANYVNENFPGSTQTQVTGLNNLGDTTGFWVTANGTNHGFVAWNGVFTSYNDPNTPHAKGSVNQLLGVNNAGIAVGFYNDAQGNSHAYELNQATGQFTPIHVPGASVVATGINNAGVIVGFATDSAGTTSSWMLDNGQLTTFQFPGGSGTQAFGVSGRNWVVGSYQDASGATHGFVLYEPRKAPRWQTIDDPGGVGSTVVNGINNAGDLVGFYTDTAGNTHGMLAVPAATAAAALR